MIRQAANIGAAYPEIVAILEDANRQKNLPGLLVVDAVPPPTPSTSKPSWAGTPRPSATPPSAGPPTRSTAPRWRRTLQPVQSRTATPIPPRPPSQDPTSQPDSPNPRTRQDRRLRNGRCNRCRASPERDGSRARRHPPPSPMPVRTTAADPPRRTTPSADGSSTSSAGPPTPNPRRRPDRPLPRLLPAGTTTTESASSRRTGAGLASPSPGGDHLLARPAPGRESATAGSNFAVDRRKSRQQQGLHKPNSPEDRPAWLS